MHSHHPGRSVAPPSLPAWNKKTSCSVTSIMTKPHVGLILMNLLLFLFERDLGMGWGWGDKCRAAGHREMPGASGRSPSCHLSVVHLAVTDHQDCWWNWVEQLHCNARDY